MVLNVKVLFLSGKYALARVLPQIFTQNPDPVIQHVEEMVAALEKCGVSERVSLLQVFGMIAKSKPKVTVFLGWQYM